MTIRQSIAAIFALTAITQSLFSQRQLISKELAETGVTTLVNTPFRQFPLYNEREQWESVPADYKRKVIENANRYIGFEWPGLKATSFLEYHKNGNRSRYEKVAEHRREVLGALLLAECLEHKGRYLNDIANGVWAICEQSYWGYPAHLSMQKKEYGLPDVAEPTVDLFAAETASLLAWTYYFLADALDTISPAISERIIYETERRVLQPNLERTDFWWMGFGDRSVNNWNPWIVSNWLTCVLILEKDNQKKEQSLKKIANCLDNFLDNYPEDGGCDEGPSYWNRAGGSLFDCLELFYYGSNKAFDIYEHPLVKSIGAYIYKVHIANDYYINFADASARMNVDPAVVFGYGKRISNDTLMKLGATAYREQLSDDYDNNASVFRPLMTLFILQELQKFDSQAEPGAVYWLPETQVLTARSNTASHEGLFLGAQGGHNNESHNHNDVGNFIVYYDGKPALIDVGVETYSAKTFSDQRYDIWTMQSAFHNCPTINGVMQSPGREFAAKDLHFSSSSGKVNL
ncbi:MAG: heparinase II/III family protein, partial [Chitinophagaceae bacterium]|nr:heparinase II/III family protein [Chitinophagaceae bacterium]